MLLFLIWSISFVLFSFFATGLVANLFGFDLISNPGELQNYGEPYVIAANKLLLAIQHVGLFILPALLFNQMFTFPDWGPYLLWKRKINFQKVLLIILLMLAAVPLINFLHGLNQNLDLPAFMSGMEKEMKDMEEQAAKFTRFLVDTGSVGELLTNILVLALIPAISEELMFRGILQKIISRMAGNVHVGIWGAAIFFSAIHFQFYGFVPRMLLGALFGYLAVWTGTLLYSMVAHFLNNFISLMLAFFIYKKEIGKEIDEYGSLTEQLPVVLVCAVLLGFIMWQFKKKSAFPEFKAGYITQPPSNLHYDGDKLSIKPGDEEENEDKDLSE